jgi:hypothetical protein
VCATATTSAGACVGLQLYSECVNVCMCVWGWGGGAGQTVTDRRAYFPVLLYMCAARALFTTHDYCGMSLHASRVVHRASRWL